VRHAVEPHHDYRKLEKHRFAADLASFIERACAEDRFDRFLLVAPPRTLGELRSLLSARVKSRLWKEIGKDFSGRPATHIASALAEDIRRAATAPSR
jgi:protein required for attachment to host cells